jgi:saccharopine dehydrogenase-like NADP-dependent oxidoreductase
MKHVVVFGAGLVARPGIRYLLDHDYKVTVATRTKSKAVDIIADHPNGIAVEFDISKDDLEKSGLIQDCDIAVSLLPYVYHPEIAKACVKYKKMMATASYVSDEMQALDEKAKEAGVLILNECGVDPGTDHMSAMRVIHEVQEKGGKIVSFKSYCGGLPAPEDNDNPLGYKFSWAPRGVLLAGRNPGKYLMDGEIIEIESGELFNTHWPMEIEGIELEAYPNRNSLPYKDLYGIPDTETMFRGTLRYPGWCETIQAMFDIGLLEVEKRTDLKDMTWKELLTQLIGKEKNDIRKQVAKKLDLDPSDEILERFEWLGFFSDNEIPEAPTTLDVVGSQFMKKLGTFKEDEKDMIIMFHEFKAEYPDGKKEYITSTLLDFGIPHGDSSMARTVSLPLAIGVRLMLEGEITGEGILIPIEPDVYNPILDELEELDIIFEEKVETLKE